ncbi:glycerol-3-phosphate dehydrogenase, putative [Eimeria brunetti]|uniref:glycerol-3-phosphate dehydrogenase n=1 Tax=Eimeria brunetti TaxID=51314 RepID=U6M002_9EIME|nr:glycerol-3-phosphate dehydrogenase, putative [Eimeria brunetti]
MVDSRLGLALALSPTVSGFVQGLKAAAAANHLPCLQILKDPDGKVIGARVKDTETNEEFDIRAKVVVNCAGPLSDTVRRMDHPDATPVLKPAAGEKIICF